VGRDLARVEEAARERQVRHGADDARCVHFPIQAAVLLGWMVPLLLRLPCASKTSARLEVVTEKHQSCMCVDAVEEAGLGRATRTPSYCSASPLVASRPEAVTSLTERRTSRAEGVGAGVCFDIPARPRSIRRLRALRCAPRSGPRRSGDQAAWRPGPVRAAAVLGGSETRSSPDLADTGTSARCPNTGKQSLLVPYTGLI